MPQKSVSHLLLVTSLTLVAAGAFGVLHAPHENTSSYLADVTDEEDGAGWCCPNFGEVCVDSDTAFTCAYTDGGILFSETKEGCQAQCTPDGLITSSSSSTSAGGGASAASTSTSAAASASYASPQGGGQPAPPPVASASSSSSSFLTSQSSSWSSVSSLSTSSSSEPGEPFYVWCADHELHVGQDSWVGFAQEREDFLEAGGVVETIDAEDIDEYWAVAFEDDVAQCTAVILSSSSSISQSSYSSVSSHSSSSSSHSFSSAQSSRAAIPKSNGLVCDRRLGIDDACYPYVAWEHQGDLSLKTLFLGDLATQNICSAVCPSLRTLAMCALEAECGPADANLCAQEGGFPIGFLTRDEAFAQGYDDPDVEAEDTCLAWRCAFFGAGC